MTASALDLIGCGLYTISDAARILSVPPRSLRRWLAGYSYELPVDALRLSTEQEDVRQHHMLIDMDAVPAKPVQGARDRVERKTSPPVIQAAIPALQDEILTFVNMIELRFVSWFRQNGVSLQVIRAAASIAAELFDADHPFAQAKFATDGMRIFAILSETAPIHDVSVGAITGELPSCQFVFTHMVEPYFRDIDFGDRWANRWWPMGRENRVVMDPARSFGQPIDSVTGVPTWAMYKTFLAERDIDRVAWWYDVPTEAVERSVEYEQSLAS